MTTLPEARPERAPVQDEGDGLVSLGWRCVFAEHTDREGNRFGKKSMEDIAARCNERITETSDFVPICIGHNGDGKDPKVVGFAGPFRTGEIGNKKKRTAIYAKWRIFKSDLDEVKRFPRCSVELWTSDKHPTTGVLDPITILGATTPELDIGIHYAKSSGKDGLRCVKYSRDLHWSKYEAVAAGGMNTSVPSLNLKEKKHYEKEGGCMLTPEDIAQIVDALKPACKAMIAEMNPAPQVAEEMPDMPQDPGIDEGIANDEAAGEDKPVDEVAADAKLPDDKAVPEGAGADAAPEEVADPKAAPEKPGDKPADDKKPEDDKDETPKAKLYKKERDEYQVKYQRLAGEHRDLSEKFTALKAEVDSSKAAERKAVRYQKLSDLKNQGYCLEVDEELADTDDLDDAAFSKHTERVVKKYQRIPLDLIPVKEPEKLGDQHGEVKRRMYEKKAWEISEDAVKKGKHVPWLECLAQAEKEFSAKAA